MTQIGWFPEARQALRGLISLARFDRRGAAVFGDDPAQCVRSFRACVLAFPLFLIVRFSDVMLDPPAPDRALLILLIQSVEFVIECVLFPLLALPLLRWYGREARWLRLVTAYNWWGLGQAILITCGVMLHGVSGGAPITEDLLLLAFLFCVIVEGFIFEIVLEAGFLTAASFVLVDICLGQGVSLIAKAMQ